MKITVKKLVFSALFVALNVVLTRFLSINSGIVRIGFGFLPIVVAAVSFGPLYAGVVYAVADFLGAILFPQGPFFPGFTLSAFLMGLVFGLMLYKKPCTILRAAITSFTIAVVFTLGFNIFWLSVFFGRSVIALLPGRLWQCLFMIPIQAVCIVLVQKRLEPEIRKFVLKA